MAKCSERQMTNQERAEKIVAIQCPDMDVEEARYLAEEITSQLDEAQREIVEKKLTWAAKESDTAYAKGFAAAREKAADIFHEHYPNEPVIERGIREMEA